jgi:hypothetical protein
MHVRERHENTQCEVTFYRYALELWQRNVVYNQLLGAQRVLTSPTPSTYRSASCLECIF